MTLQTNTIIVSDHVTKTLVLTRRYLHSREEGYLCMNICVEDGGLHQFTDRFGYYEGLGAHIRRGSRYLRAKAVSEPFELDSYTAFVEVSGQNTIIVKPLTSANFKRMIKARVLANPPCEIAEDDTLEEVVDQMLTYICPITTVEIDLAKLLYLEQKS